jgi:DNA-binding transcriptional MerR regulator
MYKLLTTKDLAERWRVSTTTVNRWVDDGVIPPVKGLPSKRFRLEDVLKLEGTEIGKLSPLERKRLLKEIKTLEKEVEGLKHENEELKDYVRFILGRGVNLVKEG